MQITTIRVQRLKTATTKSTEFYTVKFDETVGAPEQTKQAYGLMCDIYEQSGYEDMQAGYESEAGEWTTVVEFQDEAVFAEYDATNGAGFQGAWVDFGADPEDACGSITDDDADITPEMEAELIAERDEADDSEWIASTYR
jgi:hypothetical protein